MKREQRPPHRPDHLARLKRIFVENCLAAKSNPLGPKYAQLPVYPSSLCKEKSVAVCKCRDFTRPSSPTYLGLTLIMRPRRLSLPSIM